MPDKTLTELVIILDASSSMGGIWKEGIDGLIELVNKQRGLPGRQALTIRKFATSVEPPCMQARPIEQVEEHELRRLLGQPGGMTALYDGVGLTIQDVGTRLASQPEEKRPAAVLICILTDGQENSSRKYKGAQVKQMVEHQRERYGWQFIYLGANQDAAFAAADIGIHGAQAMDWGATVKGVGRAFASASSYASNYHVSTQLGDIEGARDMAFTDQDRKDNEGT